MKNAKLLIRMVSVNLFFTAILFLSAWKIDYWQAWFFLLLNLVTSVMNAFWISDEGLMQERGHVNKDAKSWDKKILIFSSVMYLITIVIAGLDSGRFLWTGKLPVWVYALGAILVVTGQIIFLVARSQNKFFSAIVRIQTDRGHMVCDTGLYSIVRHPGYLGSIISMFGIPLILGSSWCSIPILLSAILLIVRTVKEDNTLKTELPGYSEYCQKTSFRLLPKIW